MRDALNVDRDVGNRRRTVVDVLVVPAALGALIGWSVLGGLLLLDTGGIASMLRSDPLGGIWLGVLVLQFGAGFAVLVFATSLALAPVAASSRAAPLLARGHDRPAPVRQARARDR